MTVRREIVELCRETSVWRCKGGDCRRRVHESCGLEVVPGRQGEHVCLKALRRRSGRLGPIRPEVLPFKAHDQVRLDGMDHRDSGSVRPTWSIAGCVRTTRHSLGVRAGIGVKTGPPEATRTARCDVRHNVRDRYEVTATLPRTDGSAAARPAKDGRPHPPVTGGGRDNGQPTAADEQDLQQLRTDLNRKKEEIDALKREMESMRGELRPPASKRQE